MRPQAGSDVLGEPPKYVIANSTSMPMTQLTQVHNGKQHYFDTYGTQLARQPYILTHFMFI